jgi:MarR family transcriptional regulator, organic hydroperoxide resistance regulator
VAAPYPGHVTGDGDPAGEIAEHLFALADRLRAAFDEVVAGFELSPPQAKALRYVTEAGPVPMRELACRLRCDASNVTGIVDRLEQRGLVERRADRADRRIKSLVATARGAEIAGDLWAQVRKGATGMFALSDVEQHTLLTLLRRLDRATSDRCWVR